MHLAENHMDLPGIRDVPAAVARVVRRAAGLALCRVDHVALCVEAANLSRYVQQVRDQCPSSSSGEYTVGDPDSGMRIAELRDPEAGLHVVLAAPRGSRGQLVEFLSTMGGEGLQHVAFAVPDVRAAVVELADQGLRFVGGARAPELAIVETREGDNWLRQAFTEPLFGGFFVEVVERRGIVEMRPGNVDALYAMKAESEHQPA
ncbi:MAG: VOC family protein [Gammaproteobacteria bacterium]|nr:VOC family protein [Gammaproteobacteria bacterium]